MRGGWRSARISLTPPRGGVRARFASVLAVVLIASGRWAAEHPFLIFRTWDDAALQALALRSPWRENKALATI